MQTLGKFIYLALACALATACTEHKCPQGTVSRSGTCFLPDPDGADVSFDWPPDAWVAPEPPDATPSDAADAEPDAADGRDAAVPADTVSPDAPPDAADAPETTAPEDGGDAGPEVDG